MFVPVVESFPEEEVVLINITRFRSPVVNTLYTVFRSLTVFLGSRISVIYFTPSRSRLGCIKDIPLLLLGRWFNKRMIAHLHGANFKTLYSRSGALRPVIRYGYERVDTAIVLLEEMRGEFRSFPQMNIRVVANCYDRNIDLREETPVQKREQILYLSALTRSKGILEFLEAAEIVLQKNPTAEFVIAGAPEADDFMGKKEITARFHERYLRLKKNFPERIDYKGLVTGDDKFRLLFESVIFVFPSWHPSEALPVSILEAMRTGNAIVATRHNFLPVIVRPENGILTEPLSGKEIAGAIMELLADPKKLKTIQEYNRTFAREKYSPEKYCQELRRTIDEA